MTGSAADWKEPGATERALYVRFICAKQGRGLAQYKKDSAILGIVEGVEHEHVPRQCRPAGDCSDRLDE